VALEVQPPVLQVQRETEIVVEAVASQLMQLHTALQASYQPMEVAQVEVEEVVEVLPQP
jgi:hypothetical protein